MYKKKVITTDFSFGLPSSFKASDHLKGPLAKREDDANYIVSTILRRQAMGAGHGEDDFVTLNAATLNIIVAKDDAKKILEALETGGVIDIDHHYVVGKYSKRYRLNHKFVWDKSVQVKPTNSRFIRALERERQRPWKARQNVHVDAKTSDLCQQMERQYHRIEINPDHAYELIRKLPTESNPFDRQTIIVRDLISKQFEVYPTRWGRFYNSISGLHSKVRPALQFKGHSLQAVDVKNSQPALLGLATQQHHHPIHTPTHQSLHPTIPHSPITTHQTPLFTPNHCYHNHHPTTTTTPILLYDSENPLKLLSDLELFVSEVKEGRFYEAFQAELNNKGVLVATEKYARTKRQMEREDVKEGFMIHVLAKEGNYLSKLRNIFADRYPTIDAYIRWVNQADYRTLIRELQGLEAKFVIHNVAKGALLLPSNPLVLTLHDCIICGSGETDQIEDEFERAFRELGFRMALDTDCF